MVYTYDEYDNVCSFFDEMSFKALGYAPPEEMIREYVLPDPGPFLPFLLWVDETGVELPENKDSRRAARTVIANNVEFMEHYPRRTKPGIKRRKPGPVLITQGDYEEMCRVFDRMPLKAEGYAPSEELLKSAILPSLRKYAPFLLWVDSTGADTEKNREGRGMVRFAIRKMVKFIPDEDGEVLNADTAIKYGPCEEKGSCEGMAMYKAFCTSYTYTLRLIQQAEGEKA